MSMLGVPAVQDGVGAVRVLGGRARVGRCARYCWKTLAATGGGGRWGWGVEGEERAARRAGAGPRAMLPPVLCPRLPAARRCAALRCGPRCAHAMHAMHAVVCAALRCALTILPHRPQLHHVAVRAQFLQAQREAGRRTRRRDSERRGDGWAASGAPRGSLVTRGGMARRGGSSHSTGSPSPQKHTSPPSILCCSRRPRAAGAGAHATPGSTRPEANGPGRHSGTASQRKAVAGTNALPGSRGGTQGGSARYLDGVQHVDGAHHVVGLGVDGVLAVDHGVGGRALLPKVDHRVGAEALRGSRGRTGAAGRRVGEVRGSASSPRTLAGRLLRCWPRPLAGGWPPACQDCPAEELPHGCGIPRRSQLREGAGEAAVLQAPGATPHPPTHPTNQPTTHRDSLAQELPVTDVSDLQVNVLARHLAPPAPHQA